MLSTVSPPFTRIKKTKIVRQDALRLYLPEAALVHRTIRQYVHCVFKGRDGNLLHYLRAKRSEHISPYICNNRIHGKLAAIKNIQACMCHHYETSSLQSGLLFLSWFERRQRQTDRRTMVFKRVLSHYWSVRSCA